VIRALRLKRRIVLRLQSFMLGIRRLGVIARRFGLMRRIVFLYLDDLLYSIMLEACLIDASPNREQSLH
jgi:hypothetical protein